MRGKSVALLLILKTFATDAFVAPKGSTIWRVSREHAKHVSSTSGPKTTAVKSSTSTSSSVNGAVQQVGNKSDRKRRLATGMAFLTSWADVALFFKFQTFATMMTGNTIWVALALAEQRFVDAIYYVCVISSYLVGLSIFRRADLSLKKSTLPVCSFLVVGLFVGSDVLYHFLLPSRWIPVMMLATAFGIVNAVGQEVAGSLTSVVTGHMTRLVNQAVDRISRTAGRKKLERYSLVQNAAIIGGFFGGALFASLLQARQILLKFGMVSCLGILYGVLFLWKDMESLGGAWWLRKDGEMCDLDDDGELCQ